MVIFYITQVSCFSETPKRIKNIRLFYRHYYEDDAYFLGFHQNRIKLSNEYDRDYGNGYYKIKKNLIIEDMTGLDFAICYDENTLTSYLFLCNSHVKSIYRKLKASDIKNNRIMFDTWKFDIFHENFVLTKKYPYNFKLEFDRFISVLV